MTKILFATDIHGSFSDFDTLLSAIDNEKPNKIVFLGDIFYHGARNPLPEGYSPMNLCEKIKNLQIPFTIIKGNCDSEVDETVIGKPFKKNLTISSGGKTVFCTHGHKINFDNPPSKFFDAVIFGHTHQNLFKEKDGIKFINLASLSMPKNGAEKSYAVMEKNILEIKNLFGNLISRIEL